jgi:hypothetical protein
MDRCKQQIAISYRETAQVIYDLVRNNPEITFDQVMEYLGQPRVNTVFTQPTMNNNTLVDGESILRMEEEKYSDRATGKCIHVINGKDGKRLCNTGVDGNKLLCPSHRKIKPDGLAKKVKAYDSFVSSGGAVTHNTGGQFGVTPVQHSFANGTNAFPKNAMSGFKPALPQMANNIQRVPSMQPPQMANNIQRVPSMQPPQMANNIQRVPSMQPPQRRSPSSHVLNNTPQLSATHTRTPSQILPAQTRAPLANNISQVPRPSNMPISAPSNSRGHPSIGPKLPAHQPAAHQTKPDRLSGLVKTQYDAYVDPSSNVMIVDHNGALHVVGTFREGKFDLPDEYAESYARSKGLTVRTDIPIKGLYEPQSHEAEFVEEAGDENGDIGEEDFDDEDEDFGGDE